MSIFPKRAQRGGSVTIHCNVHLASRQRHVMPLLRVRVVDPVGTVVAEHAQYVLALPEPDAAERAAAAAAADPVPSQHLRRDVPLLILAGYLSGATGREQLFGALSAIESGRHFYFSQLLPPDAALGRYTVDIALLLDGRVRHSATSSDDMFFVEQLELVEVQRDGDDGAGFARVRNPGPEPVPARLAVLRAGGSEIDARLLELPADTATDIPVPAGAAFLYYSEDRRIIALAGSDAPYVLRDQAMLVARKGDRVFLLQRDQDEGFELAGPAELLWRRADGLLRRDQLTPADLATYGEMVRAGVIHEVRFG